jgi:uncharacterized protein YbaP (TraB family)
MRLLVRVPTVLFSLGLLLSGQPAQTEFARFDEESNILAIDCVRIPEADNATYELELTYEPEAFHLTELTEVTRSDSCPNIFDQLTHELSATVRVGDDSYHLTLRLSTGNSFSVVSLEHRGLGPTSLWRVSDGNSEVLIGGTIHVLQATDFPLPPAYAQAYAQSEVLVTELDLQQIQSTFLLPSFAALPVGKPTLSQSLSSETYQALSLYLAERGALIDDYETIRPNWLELDISSLGLTDLGYGAGVDAYFQALAVNDGKTNLGLESLIDQILAINQLNQHLSTEQLINRTLSSVLDPGYETQMRKLVTAWREGNIRQIEELTVLPRLQESALDHAVFLVQRNAAWIPRIVALFDTPEVELVLVGVSHLAGEDGVLAMLMSMGFEVSRFESM